MLADVSPVLLIDYLFITIFSVTAMPADLFLFSLSPCADLIMNRGQLCICCCEK